MDLKLLLTMFISFILPLIIDSRSRRCYVCRSRGPLGDCRDPFWWNSTTADTTHFAIELLPCASGWCGKAIEGKDGDHLQATERICLQRPPSDGEERCSEVIHEKRRSPVFMCFCRGDLCNGSQERYSYSLPFLIIMSLMPMMLLCM